jgi:hypothetical protein
MKTERYRSSNGHRIFVCLVFHRAGRVKTPEIYRIYSYTNTYLECLPANSLATRTVTTQIVVSAHRRHQQRIIRTQFDLGLILIRSSAITMVAPIDASK